MQKSRAVINQTQKLPPVPRLCFALFCRTDLCHLKGLRGLDKQMDQQEIERLNSKERQPCHDWD